MHSYANMRERHGNAVSQTIDSPIMIFDYWELGDAFAAIGVILVFGVLFYEWTLMMALLLVVLGIGPGDEVIVFEPYYENYGPDAILSGAVPRFVRQKTIACVG